MAIPIFEVHVRIIIVTNGFGDSKEIVIRVLADNRVGAMSLVYTILETGACPFEITRVDDLTVG